MRGTYLLIDACTVIIPLLFSFHNRINFYRQFKAFFLANAIVTLLFLVWDFFFTKWGVWGFNQNYILGVNVLNLPIEEVLFFVCIPFSCVFTFYCLQPSIERKVGGSAKAFTISFSTFLLLFGAFNYSKTYTLAAFVSTAALLLYANFTGRGKLLRQLYLTYCILLIPFIIVNGLLTGTGLAEPLVWYNNARNINVRFLTIPVEDFVYGFELVLCNVLLFEQMRVKGKQVKLASNHL